jgi:hypothetical protein
MRVRFTSLTCAASAELKRRTQAVQRNLPRPLSLPADALRSVTTSAAEEIATVGGRVVEF